MMGNYHTGSIRGFLLSCLYLKAKIDFLSPMDVFVTYDGKRAADIAVSRYAVRHLVAGEVHTRMNLPSSHLTFYLFLLD